MIRQIREQICTDGLSKTPDINWGQSHRSKELTEADRLKTHWENDTTL